MTITGTVGGAASKVTPGACQVTVPGLVAEQVRARPDAVAVRDAVTGESLTYVQLWRRAGQLAGRLTARHGVTRGDLVAVAMGRSVDFVVALLGIGRAGAAYLPIDEVAPPDRVAAIMADAGVELAVVAGDPARARPLPAGLRAVSVPAEPSREPAAEPPDVPVGPDDPCYVCYTSGSTGRPKGVVVPHRGVVRLVRRPSFCRVRPGDRVANLGNVAFDITTFEIWGPLAAGAQIVVLPQVTEMPLDEWIALVHRERPAALFLTTSVFHLVARERPAAFAPLAYVLAGGEQLDLQVARGVLAAGPPGRLVNGYGPTEITMIASSFDCTEESLSGVDRVPIGFAVQETTLHVLDDELRPVVAGKVGELCIGGPGVALGYLHRPELTAERFVPVRGETLYRTDDLVRERQGGALELVGRRDRQVKLRGFRVEPEEIELAAVATGLAAAAFVEVIGEGPGASLVGFALAPAARLGELVEALRARLPAYLVPARWVALDAVPLASTGKVDRRALLALLDRHNAPAARATEPAVAAGGVAEVVSGIWRELLTVDGLSDGDNFLDLGGNSLTAVQAAARVRERLGVDVEPAEVLLAGSLAELIELIEERNP